ncbi:MAG: transcription initiation factor IIB [Thaumarchaeota archaeon]|nr:transcription initiation factor IIB [Nitrososphaerota archaeon]MDE1831003.1 transcription initiation factor IIB [Nitrososphaerota archaeon]MDE1841459.1 transcription initiation factor IIB [Nitrososphaerota archaeon]MDE1877200.1 transcription initiation factor IIB [Nitrososphaerota archaeon]
MSKHKQILVKPVLDVSTNSSQKINEFFLKCTTPNCKGWPIVTDNVSGEILCGSCGLVLEEKSLETISSYAYDSTDYLAKKNSGMGSSLTMFDMNMTTIISDRDSLGNSLSRTAKNDFHRLKMLNTRSITSRNKTLRAALLFLNMLQMKLGMPDSVTENSAHLYRKAMRSRMTVGRKSKNLMCACVYASCKQGGIPRSILEISLTSNVGKKEIARTYRSLIEKFDLSIIPFSSKEFLARIANEAQISEKSKRRALEIISTAEETGLARGKHPKALAAASLYLACILNTEQKTQVEITKASGVTSTTIRARYNDLKKLCIESEDKDNLQKTWQNK